MSTNPEPVINGLVASIQIRRNGDSIGLHHLSDGTSLIIGKDENCGLALEDPSIAAKHCVLRMADGEVHISDWYSETGTHINGEKIYVETRLMEPDQVTIGPFQLRFSITSAMQINDANFDHPYDNVENIEDERVESAESIQCDAEPAVEMDDDFDDRASEFSGPVDDRFSQGEMSHALITTDDSRTPPATESAQNEPVENSLQCQLDKANQEIEGLKQELEYQLTIASMSSPGPANVEPDPMNVGDEELMRSEIERLQGELETRENEIQQLIAGGDPGADAIDNSETEKLVGRLEQLLDELTDSDDRARSLETMLQASDDATIAEREERQQLESWVSEIEVRIMAREQEWQAREEKLKQRLEDAETRCEKSEKTLRNAISGKHEQVQAESQMRVTELTQKNDSLATELEEVQAKHQKLSRLVEQTSGGEGDLKQLSEKIEKLRQHEVEMAQDRASVARQRAELVRLQEQIDNARPPAHISDENNPDIRVRAFRQHLKEIHEEEKHLQKKPGLASRIANLWNSLEDR